MDRRTLRVRSAPDQRKGVEPVPGCFAAGAASVAAGWGAAGWGAAAGWATAGGGGGMNKGPFCPHPASSQAVATNAQPPSATVGLNVRPRMVFFNIVMAL